MIWIDAGVGSLCGALAWLIANLVVRERKANKTRYQLLAILLFSIIFAISKVWLTPKLHSLYAAATIEKEILKAPPWQALRTHDPASYHLLITSVKAQIQQGKSVKEVVTETRNRIAPIILKRMPNTHDDIAVNYMRTNLDELKELMADPDDYCYRFLFPEYAEPVNFIPRLKKETIQRDLDALASVIRTSATSPLPAPTEAQVQPTLAREFTSLAHKYGADWELINAPQQTLQARRKVCTMSMEMFESLLALPPEQSGPALRYLMTLR
ncbi:MAG TPA: hypothetical protein VM512_03205 [Burkholderiaceae bacterium]|nr:hypothetical protein [Burkholderiaceae bacterium]